MTTANIRMRVIFSWEYFGRGCPPQSPSSAGLGGGSPSLKEISEQKLQSRIVSDVQETLFSAYHLLACFILADLGRREREITGSPCRNTR